MKLATIEENEKVSDYFTILTFNYTSIIVPFKEGQLILESLKKGMMYEGSYNDDIESIKITSLDSDNFKIKFISNDKLREALALSRLVKG